MEIILAAIALFAICLVCAESISTREVKEWRIQSLESRVSAVERDNECRKVARQKRGV